MPDRFNDFEESWKKYEAGKGYITRSQTMRFFNEYFMMNEVDEMFKDHFYELFFVQADPYKKDQIKKQDAFRFLTIVNTQPA